MFAVISAQRNRVRVALKGQVKADTTLALIGCSVDELRAHLERQFTPGMSWQNYGEWHVDHIRPCAAYDHTDLASHWQCFHFSNLQPLWAVDNLRKSDKVSHG